jgi:hypothetical protein
MVRIMRTSESLDKFNFDKTLDGKTGNACEYKFMDGRGNEYFVHLLPLPNRPGCFELEYLTQDFDYNSMTAAFIPFTISNMIFGEILSDFAREPGFREVVVRPTDHRRKLLYMRTLRQWFNQPVWSVTEDEEGDIHLIRN